MAHLQSLDKNVTLVNSVALPIIYALGLFYQLSSIVEF